MPRPFHWGDFAPTTPLSAEEIETKALSLLSQMSLSEKIDQLSGDTPRLRGIWEMIKAYNFTPIPAGANQRLGIPPVLFSDGPRGVVMYHSTCFPVSMARGASWDTALEQRIGEAIGIEVRAQGGNFFAGVCINLLRHPAWGRAQETYGEDPHHLGEMGAALVRGVQQHVMACIKHFACNSMENARFKVDVQADERTLQEIYLPHFKRCLDEGAASVMSAYNKLNGAFCGHNAWLLRQILKEEWGFQGFVISDFAWGIREAKAAVLGGLDIEMPFEKYFKKLLKLVQKGEVPEALLDDAVIRILRQKIRFAQVGNQNTYHPRQVASETHQALARQSAQKSIVLLKNDSIPSSGTCLLPLDLEKIKKIAVIGNLAQMPNTGDKGSSKVRAPYVVTALQGLREAVGSQATVSFCDGKNIAQAQKAAQEADVVVLVAGYTHKQEGEYIVFIGGDRDALTLSAHDEKLILAVAQVNPQTVVVLQGGSAIITEAWREKVPALLMGWYLGMEGGHALADVLLGSANPSGKLPCVFPKSPEQLPFFDKNATQITYDFYHGYRLMDKQKTQPAFAFGFGLSYTRFQLNHLSIHTPTITANQNLLCSVALSNTGQRTGEEVVQVYFGCANSTVERHSKGLVAFQKITLQPGETQVVTFEIPATKFAYFDAKLRRWVVEANHYQLWVGNSSRAEDLIQASFQIT